MSARDTATDAQPPTIAIDDEPINDVEQLLWSIGYERMPLAALKSLEDGRIERASWSYREQVFSQEQTHVMLFDSEGGGVDVYAHREPSAIHPATALDHYRGRDYNPKVGVGRVTEQLGDRLELHSRRRALLYDKASPYL